MAKPRVRMINEKEHKRMTEEVVEIFHDFYNGLCDDPPGSALESWAMNRAEAAIHIVLKTYRPDLYDEEDV